MYPIASRILCVLAFSLTMSPAAQAQSMPAADPAASIAPTPEIPDIAPLTAPVNSSATPAISGTRSEEHPSELQSLMRNSYAVFCLKKNKQHTDNTTTTRTHQK